MDPSEGPALLAVVMSVVAGLFLVAAVLVGRRARRLDHELASLRQDLREARSEDDRVATRFDDPTTTDQALDIDIVVFPVCVFSAAGRPLRVNRAFMAWHGGDRVDGLPETSSALGRLRLLIARRSLDVAATDDIKGSADGAGGMEWLEPVTLKSADGGTCGFAPLVATVQDGGSSFLWLILLPGAPFVGGGLSPALDQAPIGVALIDGNGRVREANQTLIDLLDTAPSQLMQRRLEDFIHEADRPAWRGLINPGASADEVAEAVELRVGDEGASFVSAFARRQSAEAGAGGPEVTVVYMIDISSRRILEERIAQSQKMQAVGQLAGGIAHDFNNLLTAMSGFCDLLLLRHRPGDPSFADIMQIKQNSNRAANLVRQLLAFSRQQTLISRVLDVTETLADLSHLLRRLIGENIDLRITHGRNLHPVKVDQSQLEQVVVNLIVNARDAMDGRGMVRMRTYNVSVDVPTRTRDEVMPPGKYVLIEVSDSGAGIADENLDRIFEPFFSTKEIGSGTGLGLSTVYGIVKQTGGFVFVESTPGNGSKFSIYLPAFDGDLEAVIGNEEYEGAGSRDLTGVGTILLVEDEDPVRLFGARALRGKGYQVIEARSGETALAMLRDARNEVDLLVTDVMMPGMDGPTLIRQVRDTLPEIRVICISGYSEDALRQKISDDIAIHFLPKPFSLKQLAGKVKEVLEA